MRCLTCKQEYLEGGQQTRSPWQLSIPGGYVICRRCCEAGKDARRREDTKCDAHPWQPIETAPKGGFPPGFTGARLTTDPAWVEPPRILAIVDQQSAIVYWDWYYAEGGRGYVAGQSAWVSDGENVNPTYWMPIPALPEELS